MQIRGGRLQQGSVIAGYRIDEPISRGGMGVVYRATNIALGQIYALKVLAPEIVEDEAFRARFKREMRLAASITHPNVVAIRYAGEQDGLLFFVMDYIEGTDLRDLLKRSGAIDPTRAVSLLTQLASALDAAHARGLVHRDVKPANVLVHVRDGEEHAYLADFGVAKRSETVAGLTAQGALVGTVDYMAPEQITSGRADARTDIYALGCVLFQMLTGHVPYDRENSVAKMFAHVHEPPPVIDADVARVYPTFGPVVTKAMAKEPADRYLSAGDFARDAEAALAGTRFTGPGTVVAIGEARPSDVDASPGPAAATPPAESVPAAEPAPAAEPVPAAEPAPPAEPAAPAEPSPSPQRRRRGPLVAGGAALAVIVAVAIVLVTGGGGSQRSASSAAGSSSGATRRLTAVTRPVPTNRVTGNGSATLRMRGDTVQVTLDANGLLNGEPHAMHIHAGGQGICPPAAAARRHNGHLSISTTDGLKFYGPPESALTLSGDTSPRSIIDFSRYPHVGDIRYSRTVTVPSGVAQAIRSGDAVIVIHGIDYNGNGLYDNVLDRSELSNALPGEATAPALCGPVFPSQTASTGGVYTATLHVNRALVSDDVVHRRLFCVIAA
jgi:hypothetical protein